MTNDVKSISIFIHSLEVGGAERVTVNFANGLVKKGYKVDIVMAHRKGKFRSLLSNQIGTVDLDIPETGLGVLTSVPYLWQYLRKAEPDILFSVGNHNNIPAVIATRLTPNSPYLIVSEHNDPSNTESSDSNRNRAVIRIARHLYPRADAIVAVSEGTASGLVEATGIPRDHITKVYNPIVTDRLYSQANEIIDHPWFSTEDQPVILSAGRLGPRKDFDTLLKAFAELNRNSECKLAIIGKGEKESKIRRQLAELKLEGEVELLGYVENVYKYMANASVFVLSSTWEGFGNVLVEAMACECPVVSSDCPSGPSEVLEDGKCGRLVPVSNPSVMADAIQRTLDNPTDPSTLRERANRFSSSTIILEYENRVFPSIHD